MTPPGGEMGALLGALDWTATPVGPEPAWPQSLRTAVGMILESRFPMMIAWGPDFTQFYNDPFRPILGSTKHPALGRGTRETFSEAWHIVGPLFARVMQGEAVSFEDMMVPLDRHGYLEECYFHYCYSPIRDETGAVGGLLVTVMETTARVIAERRLRTLSDLAAAAAHASGEDDTWWRAGSVLARNAADVPFAFFYRTSDNGRSARLTWPESSRLAPPEVLLADAESVWPLGRAMREGPVGIDDVAHRVGAVAGGAWPEPVTAAMVLPVTRPGLPAPYGFLVAGVNPRHAMDEPYREFFVLVADQAATAVGNARRYFEEKHRAEALAEVDRAKTAFFSNVSHEFRTPLALMLGPLEDALAAADPPLRDTLGMVQRNALRLSRLVNALLDFSRIEAGRVDACYSPVDLAALTRDLASCFHSVCERAGLTLDVACPELPEPVWVDRAMWEKVVLNLLSNAFKFTLRGGISVRLGVQEGAAVLRVADTGVGIPADHIARVFERFHRVPGVVARTHEGSGIGLALAHEMIKLHGGTIGVESRFGEGTALTVTIPLGSAHLPSDKLRPEAAEARAATAADAFVEEALRWIPSQGPEEAPRAAGEARPRVLVADDNADMRDYLTRLLSARFEVQTAPDGEAALARIRAAPPELVVADGMMPRLDGLGLVRAVRADPALRTLPVMLLSARAGEDARVEGLEASADDYMTKPFSARELLARVGSLIEVARVRREAEAVIRRSEDRLREADRRKDEFLATLAHELRNPLAPIRNAVALLRAGAGDRERLHAVLDRQVAHMVHLVDDLMDVSRISSGKIELRRAHVLLAEIVQAAVEAARPALEAAGHRLKVELPVEPVTLMADSVRLTQVVGNILNNAIKYTEHGGDISVTAAALADGWLRLNVRDSGIGIPPEMLGRVFDIFTQVDSARGRAQGGLGIGLSLARTLVEMHGGAIAVRSDGPGRGTEVSLRLPILSEAVAAPSGAGPAAETHSALRTRVLVVDDNHDSADMLVALLRQMGAEATAAYDGTSALERIADLRPSIVFLDLGMPSFDGYQVALEMRRRKELSSLRVIALSGWGQEEDRRRTKEAGFDAHLVKPVDPAALRDVLTGPRGFPAPIR